jgi:hypothetical protein
MAFHPYPPTRMLSIYRAEIEQFVEDARLSREEDE